MSDIKRYGIFGNTPHEKDSNSFWGCVLKWKNPEPYLSYAFACDRKLHAVSTYFLVLAQKTGGHTIMNPIIQAIYERYPSAMIPLPEDIEFEDVLTFKVSNTSPEIKAKNGGRVISEEIIKTFNKYSDRLAVLYHQFKAITTDFAYTNTMTYNAILKSFFDKYHLDQLEVKTYNVNETRHNSDTGSSTTDGSGSETQKHADTPEIIPQLTQEESINQFISMLNSYNRNSLSNSSSELVQDKNFDKTGTVETEKQKEHFYFDVLDKLQDEYYKILDEIVNGLAITFNLED